jgi:hypothetical protein
MHEEPFFTPISNHHGENISKDYFNCNIEYLNKNMAHIIVGHNLKISTNVE